MLDSIYSDGWKEYDGKQVYQFDLMVSYDTLHSMEQWIELEGFENVCDFRSPWDGGGNTLVYLLISDEEAAAFFKLTWCE